MSELKFTEEHNNVRRIFDEPFDQSIGCLEEPSEEQEAHAYLSGSCAWYADDLRQIADKLDKLVKR